jgi:hypothetical protein
MTTRFSGGRNRSTQRTTDHGQSTGKLYHLRLRVECTLFCTLQRRARIHAVLVIGLYELNIMSFLSLNFLFIFSIISRLPIFSHGYLIRKYREHFDLAKKKKKIVICISELIHQKVSYCIDFNNCSVPRIFPFNA